MESVCSGQLIETSNSSPLGSASYRVVLFSFDEDSGTTSIPASVIEIVRLGDTVELLRTVCKPGFRLELLGL